MNFLSGDDVDEHEERSMGKREGSGTGVDEKGLMARGGGQKKDQNTGDKRKKRAVKKRGKPKKKEKKLSQQ